MSPWFFGPKRLQRVLSAGVPPLLRFPEKVNERFAASCRRCPRRAVAVESIEMVSANLSITGAIWQMKGKPDVLEDVSIEAELHHDVSAHTQVNYK